MATDIMDLNQINSRIDELAVWDRHIRHRAKEAHEDLVVALGAEHGVVLVKGGEDSVVGVYVHGASSKEDAIKILTGEPA